MEIRVIVGGEAYSGDFPVTPGAFQTVYAHAGTGQDAFITRFDPTGSSLEWSTFLGGSSVDRIFALAADDSGVVTVAGGVLLKLAFEGALSSATRGEKLQGRYLFRNPPGCPGEGAWSFSNRLLVTVQ